MAFLGLQVPHPTARILSEVDIQDLGERESTDTYHITLMYLGKEMPIEDVARTIPAIFSVTSKTKPFTVSTSLVSTFSPNPDDGVPIIARVDSPELHALRDELWKAFDATGVPFSKKYPEFKPHVTLAYSPDQTVHGTLNVGFPPVEWGAHEIVLWGGDHGDTKVVVTFPFSLANTKQASDRAFVQLAQNWPK